jgi:hypothetical protein
MASPLSTLELAMTYSKEAGMKIRINYIFWKQGPLLPRLLCDSKI